MALTLVSAATTAETASSGSLVTVNLPGSLVSGNLIVLDIFENNNKTLTRSGYTQTTGVLSSGDRNWTRLHKVSDGTEGATAELTVSAANTEVICVATQWSGQHATPFSANKASGEVASIDPFVLAADTITSIGADSKIVHVWGSSAAQRTITTLDADLTQYALSASLGFSASNACLFLAVEDAPGSGNAAISTDMSSAWPFSWAIYEIIPAASGPLTDSRTDGVVMGEGLGTSWIVDDGPDGVKMGDDPTVDLITAPSTLARGKVGISISLSIGL